MIIIPYFLSEILSIKAYHPTTEDFLEGRMQDWTTVFRMSVSPSRAKDTMRVLYPDKSWRALYILGLRKNVTNGEEQFYPVEGTGIYYNYLILKILALNAGAEWISDFSVKEKIRREYVTDPGSAPNHNRVAILIGVDLLFGCFTFVHQWGFFRFSAFGLPKIISECYIPCEQYIYL